MTTARRLDRLQAARLMIALRDFRRTLDAFDTALAARHATMTPEERAALAEQAEWASPGEDALVERLFAVVPILRDAHATPGERGRAIAQLEPLVVPRGSPDYVIVGAIRRLYAGWLAEEERDAGAGEMDKSA